MSAGGNEPMRREGMLGGSWSFITEHLLSALQTPRTECCHTERYQLKTEMVRGGERGTRDRGPANVSHIGLCGVHTGASLVPLLPLVLP